MALLFVLFLFSVVLCEKVQCMGVGLIIILTVGIQMLLENIHDTCNPLYLFFCFISP